MASLLVFGFLLGIRHALEADHIATVATLVSTHSSRREMMRQAIAWGIGHSLMLLFFCSLVLWLDTLIPERVASGLEMAVGAMMIVLGIGVVRRTLNTRLHFHTHSHDDGRVHLHAHSHSGQAVEQHDTAAAHQHRHQHQLPVRALLMGLLHGMAGSAALILLFVDRIDSVLQGILYVAVFSVGSIAGMLLFSAALSIPLGFTARKLTALHNGLQVFIGLVTSAIGLFIMVNTLQ